LAELQLPVLEKIKKAFVFSDNASMDSLGLPNLQTAELLALESNTDLHYFEGPKLMNLGAYSVPDLRYSGSGLWMTENPRLQQIELPLLQEIEGKLYLLENLQLERWSLPKVDLIGADLIIREHKKLNKLQFPLLDTVKGSLIILLNDELSNLPLPALSYIGGTLRVQNNPELRSLQIPKLKRIHENIFASFNALRSQDVNQLLSIPANSPERDIKTIHLQGQIPKAAPYGNGIRYKSLLQSQGSEVKTD
jgi:hypothetical protein